MTLAYLAALTVLIVGGLRCYLNVYEAEENLAAITIVLDACREFVDLKQRLPESWSELSATGETRMPWREVKKRVHVAFGISNEELLEEKTCVADYVHAEGPTYESASIEWRFDALRNKVREKAAIRKRK
jgi:hypothetical protein